MSHVRTITSRISEAYFLLGVFIAGLIVIEWAVLAGVDDGFMARWHCWHEDPKIAALEIVSDATIALAYFAIPFELAQIARLNPRHSYNRVMWAFAGFIVLCGLTHVMGVVLVWYPAYWIDGAIKFATAIFSIAVAIYTRRLRRSIPPMPDVLKMVRGYRFMEQRIARLRESYPELREQAEEDQAADEFEELEAELKLAINFISAVRGEGQALPEEGKA